MHRLICMASNKCLRTASNVAVRMSIKKAPRKSKSPSLMGSVDLRVGAKISGPMYWCRSSFSVRPNFGTTQNVPSQFSTKRMVYTHPKTAHPKLLWHAEPCGKRKGCRVRASFRCATDTATSALWYLHAYTCTQTCVVSKPATSAGDVMKCLLHSFVARKACIYGCA